MKIKHPEVKVQLTGRDGNAFAILEAVRKAMRRGGISGDEIDQFTALNDRLAR